MDILIDLISMLVLVICMSIPYIVGYIVKKRGKSGMGWWLGGAILHLLYCLSNVYSLAKYDGKLNYVNMIIGVILAAFFYILLHNPKPKAATDSVQQKGELKTKYASVLKQMASEPSGTHSKSVTADDVFTEVPAEEAGENKTPISTAKHRLAQAKKELKELKRAEKTAKASRPKKWLIVGLCAISIGLAGLNVYQYAESKTNEKNYESNIELVRSARDDFSKQLTAAQSELTFWDTNACICTTDGEKYHHYGCGHTIGRDFYIYNTEKAKAKGYTPCLDCWE